MSVMPAAPSEHRAASAALDAKEADKTLALVNELKKLNIIDGLENTLEMN